VKFRKDRKLNPYIEGTEKYFEVVHPLVTSIDKEKKLRFLKKSIKYIVQKSDDNLVKLEVGHYNYPFSFTLPHGIP